jgi:hypothetical protein
MVSIPSQDGKVVTSETFLREKLRDETTAPSEAPCAG